MLIFILFPPPDECLLTSEGEFRSDDVLGEGKDKFDVVLFGEPEELTNIIQVFHQSRSLEDV